MKCLLLSTHRPLLLALLGLLLMLPLSQLRHAPVAFSATPAGLTQTDWKALQALLPPTQQTYLKASNTGVRDLFGGQVAVSGNTVVVGSPSEDSAATGANGNQSDNSADGSGAVYVFVRNGTKWSQQAYLKASNTGESDFFGWSVAISGDTIAVGAPYESSAATGVNGDQADNSAIIAGAVYVFVRNGTEWSQQSYLKASNTGESDFFGWSVAISGDTIAVGALFERSAATGVNGNQSDNSAGGSGAAYVFVRNGTEWSQQAYLKASNTQVLDMFGYAVAVSGDTVVVAAPSEDSAATGVNGNQADNSAMSAGAVYVFVRNGTEWSQQAYLKASNTGEGDSFGYGLALSDDTIVVGAPYKGSTATGVNGNQTDNTAPGAGAAYVFVRNGAEWSQQAFLKASNSEKGDLFGGSVGISKNSVVISAAGEDSVATGVNGNGANNGAESAGAAYVFVRNGTTWSEYAYLKASNTGLGDIFGNSVAVSESTVVVGAVDESSAATGVNGNGSDNSMVRAGAAYVFVPIGTTRPDDPPPILAPRVYLPFIPLHLP
ncbi:MAG TPA: FG-GAP repeat protein [Roseiflexaceae bacterium]|nr:FG-GAP repeat protein [Roseiflexaceae bacterium]